MSYVVLATIQAKPGKGKEVIAHISKIRDYIGAGKEPGTKVYEPCVSKDDPDKIVVWEEYENQAAHMAHREGADFQAFFKQIPEICTGAINVQILDRF